MRHEKKKLKEAEIQRDHTPHSGPQDLMTEMMIDEYEEDLDMN